jgi:two-component system cell cycle response regulator
MSSPPQTHCLTNGFRSLLAAGLDAIRSSDSADEAGPGPCLVRVHPDGSGLADRYPLGPGPVVVVGRAAGPGVGVVLPHETVSRAHVRLTPLPGGRLYRVWDLGSTNGTYVNEVRTPDGVLGEGDFLRVGACVLRYHAGQS